MVIIALLRGPPFFVPFFVVMSAEETAVKRRRVVEGPSALGRQKGSVGALDAQYGYGYCKKVMELGASLPAEAWAHILEYLDLSSVVCCTSLNSFFVSEVAASVKTIRAGFGQNLGLSAPAVKRFGGAEHVFIYLARVVIEIDGSTYVVHELDFRAMRDLSVFLSNFPKLSRCYIGLQSEERRAYCSNCQYDLGRCDCFNSGFDLSGETTYYDDMDNDTRRETWAQMIHSICQGYMNGTLSSGVRIDGIVPRQCPYKPCAWRHSAGDTNCATCRLLCRTFPIEQVLEWYHVSLPCVEYSDMVQIVKWRDFGNFRRNMARAIEREIRLLGYLEVVSCDTGRICRVLDLYPRHPRSWRVGSILSKIRLFVRNGLGRDEVVGCFLKETRQAYYLRGKRLMTKESFDLLADILGVSAMKLKLAPFDSNRKVDDSAKRCILGDEWRTHPKVEGTWNASSM